MRMRSSSHAGSSLSTRASAASATLTAPDACAVLARVSDGGHEASFTLETDERFLRLWTLYLAYCEGGFEERRLSNVQLLFAKPGNRRAQFVPELHTEVTP